MASTYTEKVIKDGRNFIIGWCRDYGDKILAISIKKNNVGFYLKSSDLTFDNQGKIYCYGDGTADLIRHAERQ